MSSPLQRFFGGDPKIVALKLVVFSILIGVLLSFLGLNPYRLLYSLQYLWHVVFENAFDFLEGLWRYFLLGAALVVPIWLIMRLFATKNTGNKHETGVENTPKT